MVGGVDLDSSGVFVDSSLRHEVVAEFAARLPESEGETAGATEEVEGANSPVVSEGLRSLSMEKCAPPVAAIVTGR